jgi:hypothetical protein
MKKACFAFDYQPGFCFRKKTKSFAGDWPGRSQMIGKEEKLGRNDWAVVGLSLTGH